MSDKNAICNRCKFDYTGHQLEIMCMDENGNCQKCRAELSGKFADGKSLMIGADMVNHPPHYKDESGIECCQVTDLMMFNAASCFKYLYRCGNKWNDIEDLKKAVWYAKRSYLTGDNEQPNSLEWDNNVKEIASYREHGIYKAMTAIRSYSWSAVAAFIENEIARLESE